MNKQDFPFLKDYIYLDTAAGALKPRQVIQEIINFYNDCPINPHSVNSSAGVKIHRKIHETRELVANLLEASPNEIIFTSGTTDSLNKLAYMLSPLLSSNNEILVGKTNHSSSIVPFIELAKRTKAKLKIKNDILNNINVKTKVVVLVQASNSYDMHYDWENIYQKCQQVGAILVNDAAQAVLHQEVSLNKSSVIAFSGNKLYGPTGIGVLAIRKQLLQKLSPATFGGGATATIINNEYTLKSFVGDYEAGTPNSAGIVGLGAAIKYFNQLVKKNLFEHEKKIAKYAFQKLAEIKKVKIYSREGDYNILFNIKDVYAQDVVSYFGHRKIILRAGSHCSHLVSEIIETNSTIRLSIGAYNSLNDIDQLTQGIIEEDYFLEDF